LSVMAGAAVLVSSDKALVCSTGRLVAVGVSYGRVGVSLRLLVGDSFLCRVVQFWLMTIAGVVPAMACRHWAWVGRYPGSNLCTLVVPSMLLYAAIFGGTGFEAWWVLSVFCAGTPLGSVFVRTCVCTVGLLLWTARFYVFVWAVCGLAVVVWPLWLLSQKFVRRKWDRGIVVEEWPKVRWWYNVIADNFCSRFLSVKEVNWREMYELHQSSRVPVGDSDSGDDDCGCEDAPGGVGALGFPAVGIAGIALMPFADYQLTHLACAGKFLYGEWVRDVCGVYALSSEAEKCLSVVLENSQEWHGEARDFRRSMALLGDALLRTRLIGNMLEKPGVCPGDIGEAVASRLSNRTMLRSVKDCTWFGRFSEAAGGAGERAAGTRFEAIVAICYLDMCDHGSAPVVVLDYALHKLERAVL